MNLSSHIDTEKIKGKNTLKDSLDQSILQNTLNDSNEPSFNNFIINSNLDSINQIK